MVGLPSLLFIWTALLFGYVQCDGFCFQLEPSLDLFQQMEDCSGAPYKFNRPHEDVPINLSTWTQEKFNKIFYDQDGKPKSISGKVLARNSNLAKMGLYFSGNISSLEVVGNKMLHTLSVKRDKPSLRLELVVRNNKVLRHRSLKKLNTLKGDPNIIVSSAGIQEFGECDFGGKPIGEVSDLAKCVYVTGDLKIDKSTRGTFGSNVPKLEKVHGCIEVDGSSLDNLKFLEKVTSTKCTTNKITGNLDLCLSSDQVLKLRNSLGNNVTISGNKVCDDECKVAFAEANPTAKCNVIVGDISINKKNEMNVGQWDRVEVLNGTITVQSTDLENITIFANLTKIIHLEGKGKNALHVLQNSKITSFKMPSLTIIDIPTSSNGRPFVWDSNGGFMFTFAEKENWLKIINRSQLDIPVDPGTVPTPPPTTPSPTMATTLHPDVVKHNMAIADNNNTRNNLLNLLLPGGFFICALPFIVWGICFGIYYIQHKNKERRWNIAARAYTPVSMPLFPSEGPCSSSDEGNPSGSSRSEPLTQSPEDSGRLLSEDGTVRYPTNITKALLEFFTNCASLKYTRIRQEAARLATEEPFKAPYATLVNLYLDPKSREGGDFAKEMARVERKIHKSGYGQRMIRLPKEFRKFTFNPMHFKCTNATDDWLTIDIDPKNPDMATLMRIVERLLTNTGSLFRENPKCFIHCMEYCASKGNRYGGQALRKVTGAWRMIGDIHGSMFDLLAILNSDPNGEAAALGLHPIHYYRFVFLGDYVDRGLRSLECIGLLLLLGVLFPENFVLLRGNHEGFVEGRDKTYVWHRLVEYYKKKRPDMGYFFLAEWMVRSILEVTVCLPLAALINDQIFCAHGGISHRMKLLGGTLDDVFKKFLWPFRSHHERTFMTEPAIDWKYDEEDVVKGAGTPDFIRNKPVDLFSLEKCNKMEKNWKQMAVDYDKNSYKAKYMEEYKAKFGNDYGHYKDENSFYNGLNNLAVDIMWSDYCPKLTSSLGTRGVSGGLFGDALLRKYSAEYGIEMAVFAHVMCYFKHSCDLACWVIFGCNNSVPAGSPKAKWGNIQLNSDDWTGVIDMTACDQFRMLLYQQTTEKDADQELMDKKSKPFSEHEEKAVFLRNIMEAVTEEKKAK